MTEQPAPQPGALSRALALAAAAALGALGAAVVEAGAALHGAALRATSAAYALVGLWPLCAVTLGLGRFALAGWRAAPSASSEPAAPPAERERAAAAIAVGSVLLASVAWVGYCAWLAVRWAAVRTAFSAHTMIVLLPSAVVAAGLIAGVLAWPAVRALRAGCLGLDERWRARRDRPLLTMRRAAGLGVGAVAAAAGGAAVATRPVWSALDGSALAALGAPALALTLAVLASWRWAARLRGRAGLAVCGLAALVCASAGGLSRSRPAWVLDVWAEPTFAAEVIAQLADPAALRADVLPKAAAPRAIPGAAHPDVILLTIDTVRADRTPLFGGPAAMPALAQLASRGAVMTRAFAPGNVTRRSLPSLAIGVSPTRVRGKPHGWALELDPRHVLLAERFAAAGYHTAGFFCCQSFWGRELRLGLDRGIAELVIDPDGGVLVQRAAALLRERQRATAPAPLFLWMHLLEPHRWNGGGAFAPPPGQARERYDAALAALDPLLGQLFDAIDPARQLVVVTSDHGEGLGDHGAPFHGTNLSSSQIWVPLVFAGPGVRPARHAEVTGLIDVAPTVLELAGWQPSAAQLEGRSLAPLLRGERKSDDDGGYAFAAMIRDRSVTENRQAVIRGRWKLTKGPHGYALYDLLEDPGEQKNVAGTAGVFSAMRQLLRDRGALDATPPFAPLSR